MLGREEELLTAWILCGVAAEFWIRVNTYREQPHVALTYQLISVLEGVSEDPATRTKEHVTIVQTTLPARIQHLLQANMRASQFKASEPTPAAGSSNPKWSRKKSNYDAFPLLPVAVLRNRFGSRWSRGFPSRRNRDASLCKRKDPPSDGACRPQLHPPGAIGMHILVPLHLTSC